MTKRFDNNANGNNEKALRRGFKVPEGAVNLAWVKSPKLTPKNNILIVDASKASGENQNYSSKRKNVAFANALGILEDENGNQIWNDEYPIVSDIFLIPEDEIDQEDYTDESILPYVHVSRYFHIDFAGLANQSLDLYEEGNIKIVDKNGLDYVDANGQKLYKIYLIEPVGVSFPPESRESVYRIYAFLDSNLIADELYLSYSKVELNTAGGTKNQELQYRERINPRPYFSYVPEETDVIDVANSSQKIFSSKPSNLKEQISGIPQPNFHGWKYYVPRKAIPDPRIFQIFKWRLACEFTQPMADTNTNSPFATFENPRIKVGVVIPPNGNHLNTRANFFFHQLNRSDYNFSKIIFENPLQDPNADKDQASYWHVDLINLSVNDLSKFDVLLWAPTGETITYSALAPKINLFVEHFGGTFIFETSSYATGTDIPGITFSPSIKRSPLHLATSDFVTAESLRMYDATPEDEDDTFRAFGMWQEWPPNINGILNSYTDTGSILIDGDTYAGWNLDDEAQETLSGFQSVDAAKFQYISAYGEDLYAPVMEALTSEATPSYQPTVIHRRTSGGGNIFISSGCLFEDHLFHINGVMASKSLQTSTVSNLTSEYQISYRDMVSSPAMEGEMKLRLNIMLFATLHKPSPNKPNSDAYVKPTSQTVTIYSDWMPSWVINPTNDVLSEREKTKYGFALLSVDPESSNPVWQRVLSEKSVKQIIKDKIEQLDPNHTNILYNGFEGATKRYYLIATNPLVQMYTSDFIADNTIPTAWTNAYSPKFLVPYHLGAYAVRDEMIAGTGVGEGKRTYPPRSFALRASASYVNSGTASEETVVTLTLSGTARRVVKSEEQQTTTQIWVPAQADRLLDVVLHWNTDGANAFENVYKQQDGWPKPIGIDFWTQANYGRTVPNNWPYPGLHGTLSVKGGDRGYMVTVAQKILNQMIFFGVISGPYLKEDGIFGSVTASAVLRFQIARGAKWLDGIIDAETWSLLGYSLVAISKIPGWNVDGLNSIAATARQFMQLESISDDNPNSFFVKQSWESNGPGTIKETFQIKFSHDFPIYRVSVMPFTAGTATNNLTIDWLDLAKRDSLVGYDFSSGFPGKMTGKSGGDGKWIDLDFWPVTTNNVIFRAVQTGRAGWGSARIIGIRDVAVYGKKYFPGVPGHYVDVTTVVPGKTYEETVAFSGKVTLNLRTGKTVWISPLSFADSDLAGEGELTFMAFNPGEVEISPSAIANYFDIELVDDGKPDETTKGAGNILFITYKGYDNVISGEYWTNGPTIGDGTTSFYTKNVSGEVDPFQQSFGWIRKDDNLKLVCDANGNPYGFPATLPTAVTSSTHFARFRLDGVNVDQTIQFGFYDIQTQEFITDAYGAPEVTYYDYIRRGPQNIFIAVRTSYELDTYNNIPGGLENVMHPFKWAMPVYGITTQRQSKIQIQPLSDDLGPEDVWSIPIKTGSFSRMIELKPRSYGSYTTYIKDYQGSTVKAFYSIPESKDGPWSSLFGRPFVDIKGEIPSIIDDKTIRIKQFPILISQIPTAEPSLADPWLPAFKVYRRDSVNDTQWTEVPFADIEDYNIWDGTIVLRNTLANNDPRLIKVDYTSNKNVYNFKSYGSTKVNLNPYLNDRSDWRDKPLFVYIVPEYVLDSAGSIISSSLQSRTVRITTDPNIFNQAQVNYDPTAILLGIVFISTAMDINKLSILDTRKRGGGISSKYEIGEALNVQSEADSYWDIVPDTATSYQKGGFITIRLPSSLRSDFSDDYIRNVIEKNITIGLGYKIEFVDDLGEDGAFLLSSDGYLLTTSDLVYLLWSD